MLSITVSRSFVKIAAATLLICVSDAYSSDTLPTYAEVASGYRQTIESMMPLSVEWEDGQRALSGLFDSDLTTIPMLKALLEGGGLSQGDAQLIKSQLRDAEMRTSKGTRELHEKLLMSRQFLWTDGRNFQYRKRQKTHSGTDELDPTAGDLSGDVLLEAFAHVNVHSFVGDRTPKLRSWVGKSQDGQSWGGATASKNLRRVQSKPFPPLGFPLNEWGIEQEVSPLDTWLTFLPDKSNVEVGEEIDGNDTLILRAVRGGGLDGRVDRVAVWVLPDKGFIPIRIERSFSGGEPTVEPQSDFPSRVLEITSADRVEKHGESYYPSRIVSTKYEVDHNWRATQPQDKKIPFSVDVKMAPTRERIQEIKTLNVHRELSAASLSLPFPKGTRYLDEDSNEWFLEGTPKEDFDRQLVKELTGQDVPIKGQRSVLARTSAPNRTWILVGVNVAALAFLAIVYRFSKRAAR